MIVDAGSTMLPDMVTDASAEHVYTISAAKVRPFFCAIFCRNYKLESCLDRHVRCQTL